MAELLKPDFETVFEVYYDRVYKYAYTILLNRENAEDVVEETFLAAYVVYPGYDPARSSLATWLTRIAHNKAVNLVRSAAYRRETAMPEDFADRSPSVQDEPRYTVLWLYARLTQEEREFLDLRYVMGLTDKEVGALYSLESKAVNKRYQRLLKRCRQLLDGGEKPENSVNPLSPIGVLSCIYSIWVTVLRSVKILLYGVTGTNRGSRRLRSEKKDAKETISFASSFSKYISAFLLIMITAGLLIVYLIHFIVD